MLKRNDPTPPDGLAEPDGLAALFGRARSEALAWLEAEVELYKTIGLEKASAWKLPAILLGAALFLAHAALLALVATLFVGLAQLMNPALAGLLTALIFGGTAAILARVGLARLKGAGK